MILIEQFEEILKDFERNFIELCTSISEIGTASFSRLRELETEHFEKFKEFIMSLYERFGKGDNDEVEDEIRDVILRPNFFR